MRKLQETKKFRKDLKKIKKNDPKAIREIAETIKVLVNDQELPESYCDHALKGELKGIRDCHVRPDMVLLYKKIETDILVLVRVGSHSELFE